jgi:hypothetical protein
MTIPFRAIRTFVLCASLMIAVSGCVTATPAPTATVPPATPTAGSPTTAPTETAAPTGTSAASPTAPETLTLTPALPAVTYPVGPTGFPADVDPLTGLRVSDPNILDRRPLAIKISNFPRSARDYLSGISRADMIWEFYTEFGNTRFLAMFYGQDSEKVGPVRSARILDGRIVPHYDAILVHVQAFELVYKVLSQAGVDTINEFPAACPALCRDASVPDPVNSVFGNTVALTAYARKVGLLSGGQPNLDGMVFDTAVPAGGSPSAGAFIHFTMVTLAEWKWDAAIGRYLRFSDSGSAANTTVALIDHSTGAQVAADNVIVLFAPIFRYPTVNPASGEVWDVDLSGSGRAMFFRDGTAVDGTWKNAGPNAPIQFFTAAGAPFALHPGATYVGMINDKGSASKAASTEWDFYDFH